MFMTHLECSLTGERYDAKRAQGLSKAGKPLLVRYDLAAIAAGLSCEELASRPSDMWKWKELLPLQDGVPPVSHGEPATPIIPLTRLARKSGAAELIVKD